MRQIVNNVRFIFLTLFILFSISGVSQTYSLEGSIQTNDPEDIFFGNVFLMDKDNSVVKSAAVENNAFSMSLIEGGEYLLVTTCIGFEKKTDPITINENKKVSIQLQGRTINLNEIVIEGRKQTFIHKNGNLKINIDNPFFRSFPDLVDLLSKMPSIQVSPDQESISIIGKGSPLIYMGNQRITVNELKALSADDIESIDIINNPSSKYEADGRAVILLTRKIKKQEGYKVTLTERAAMKTYFNNNLSVGVNYLKNKFELKANAEYNQLKIWEKNGFDFNIKDENIQSDYMTEAVTNRPQLKMSLGAYYQLNENDYISADMSGRPLNETYTIKTKTFVNDRGQKDNILTETYNKDNGLFYSGNLNYVRKIKSVDGKLFVGGQYTLFDRNIKSDIADNYESTAQTLHRQREQNYKVNAYSFKADYEQKFKNGITWEIGSKVSLSDARTKAKTTSVDIAEANNSSDYSYNERIYGAYTQLSGKISTLSYTGGVRVENTDIRRDNNKSKENYTKLFPKLSVDMPIDSSKSLSASYSRSIARPSYKSSSQLDVYINPFYAMSGNIYLKPFITDEISVNMQIKKISFGVTYNRTKNPIYFRTEYDSDQKLLRLIQSNFEKEEGYTLNLSVPLTYKSFSTTTTLNWIYNKVGDSSSQSLKTKPYLYYYSSNQLSLPKDFVFTVTGWGVTKRKEGIFDRNALVVVDMSLSKRFFNKLDCSLLFSDVFKSMKFDEQFVLNNIESKGIFYTDVNAIALSLKYSFGKDQKSKYKNKSVEDNLYRMK